LAGQTVRCSRWLPHHASSKDATRRSPSAARFRTSCSSISGRDAGEHGNGPLSLLDDELRSGPYALFVDARRTLGASIDVSNIWAQWLRAHRDHLLSIHMLTGSKFVQLTADFVRRFADLGDTMRIYTDGAAFDEALRAETQH
jgi:hypothetical protein